MIEVDDMSNPYLELLKKASEVGDSSIVFTIPPGFENVEQDEDALKRQEILQQFEQILLDVKVAARG